MKTVYLALELFFDYEKAFRKVDHRFLLEMNTLIKNRKKLCFLNWSNSSKSMLNATVIQYRPTAVLLCN